jgi:anaerobic selenocysteine-containing dehydrogenase
VGRGANFSPAIFPPADGRPHEWELMIRLAGVCLGQDARDVDVAAIDDGFFDVLAEMKGIDGPAAREQYDEGGPERLLDFTLRTGPEGDRYGERPGGLTLEELKQHPHGMDFGPNRPCLDEILATEDGKLHLAPEYIVGDVPRLAARLDRPADDLVLVNRRHLRSNNSWMHNVNVLVKGKPRCTLLVHPTDAARHGIRDGELTRVTSTVGAIDVPAEVTEDIRPGVVSLPHGWGHNLPGTRLSVANEHAGVNSNVLAPGTFVDVISGNAAVNGFPVTIAPSSTAGAGSEDREMSEVTA